MTFTTAEPPPVTYVSKKKQEEFEERKQKLAMLAVKNCAGSDTKVLFCALRAAGVSLYIFPAGRIRERVLGV